MEFYKINTHTHTSQGNNKHKIKVVVIHLGANKKRETFQVAKILKNNNFSAKPDFGIGEGKYESKVIVFNRKNIHNSKFRKKVRICLEEHGIKKSNKEQPIVIKSFSSPQWKVWFTKNRNDIYFYIPKVKKELGKVIHNTMSEYGYHDKEKIDTTITLDWIKNGYNEVLRKQLKDLNDMDVSSFSNARVRNNITQIKKGINTMITAINQDIENLNSKKEITPKLKKMIEGYNRAIDTHKFIKEIQKEYNKK